ncbi:MAG: DUF368 domain-containing protein, partial [Lentisphaeria bacterium]|nr:DUF368 domain-containing protein [Lentisphaeria bacterium]
IVCGISVFVRFLSWLLKKYNDITVAVLIGFMLGSLRKVWPWKVAEKIENANIMPDINANFFTAVILAIAGFFLVLAIEYAAKHLAQQKKEIN